METVDTTEHGVVADKYTDLDYLRSIEVTGVKYQQFDYAQTLDALKVVNGVTIIYEDNELQRIVAKIDSYDASCRIGSKNWCISSVIYGGSLGQANGIMYWNLYLGNQDHRQYFVWDFKQLAPDWVLIGTTTVESKNKFYCAYNYPNCSFDIEKYIADNNWDRSLFFNNDHTTL